MKIINPSFATANMHQSHQQLVESSRKYGLIPAPYKPENISKEFVEKHNDIFNNFKSRGAGYWLWKPYIIMKEMEKADDGDLVFYTDAGMYFDSDPSALIDIAKEQTFTFFDISGHNVGHWTKRDCFIEMGCDGLGYDNELFTNAAMFILKVNDESRAFMNEYSHWCKNEVCITDKPSTLGPELSMYRGDHRHDQSILSILARKHKIIHHRDPSQYGKECRGAYSNSDYDTCFFHHRSKK